MAAQIVKLEYYQSADSKVVITLYEKNIDESKIAVECEEKHLKVSIGDRILLNTSLYKEVIPEQVSYSVKPRKIEITLTKKEPSTYWNSLEDKDRDEKEAQKLKISKDRWGALIHEVEEDEAEAKDVDGVLKKMFAQCSDDAKKAMMKSWSESNGKVLSMNWDEVKQKKCEYKSKDGEENDSD